MIRRRSGSFRCLSSSLALLSGEPAAAAQLTWSVGPHLCSRRDRRSQNEKQLLPLPWPPSPLARSQVRCCPNGRTEHTLDDDWGQRLAGRFRSYAPAMYVSGRTDGAASWLFRMRSVRSSVRLPGQSTPPPHVPVSTVSPAAYVRVSPAAALASLPSFLPRPPSLSAQVKHMRRPTERLSDREKDGRTDGHAVRPNCSSRRRSISASSLARSLADRPHLLRRRSRPLARRR